MAHDGVQKVTNDGPGLTRRRWVATATTGFVLSAGGLFLPELVRETEARSGANGGELGGRHGKNRRGKDQKRSRGDKKEHGGKGHDDPPGRWGRGIEFAVDYGRSSGSLKVEFYAVSRRTPGGDEWASFATRTVAPHAGASYAVDAPHLSVWIAGRYFVGAINNATWYPSVTLGYGGSWSTSGWSGTVVVDDRSLRENEVAPAMNVDGYSFSVKRETDSDANKRFTLVIS